MPSDLAPLASRCRLTFWFACAHTAVLKWYATIYLVRPETDAPLHVARAYADVNVNQPPERFDIANVRLTYGRLGDYQLGEKLGEGAYSEVFSAFHLPTQKLRVVKQMRAEKMEKIKLQREWCILSLLQGHRGIVKMFETLKDPVSKVKYIAFEHIDNPDFRLTFFNFTDMEARLYLFKLLEAIDYAHSQGIMHRDIKPRNVLYDPTSHKLRLIDWGFGEFYMPGRPMEKWPGTRYYKAPELFFRYPYYDYAVDMWSYGCIIASICFARVPIFKGKEDSLSQLVEITKCLGTEGLHRYLVKYRIAIRTKFRKGIHKRKARPFEHYINPKHADMCSPEAIDLVSKLLVWDHERRWSSKEALAHAFFDPVRSGQLPEGHVSRAETRVPLDLLSSYSDEQSAEQRTTTVGSMVH